MARRRSGPVVAPNETPQHRALGTESRAEILRLVQASGDALTAPDVVERVGLHPSTVRAHLEQLVEAGLLMKARASDGAPGRPAWRYRAAAPEPAPGPYRALAEALLDHLATAGARTVGRVGQSWGRQLAATVDPREPLPAVLEVLRRLGFDPQVADGLEEVEVHLRTCPFLDLVARQPDATCGLHAGMIRGVVRASGAPRAEVVLEPFATASACVVRLRLSPVPGTAS